jgi:hypothetical protein
MSARDSYVANERPDWFPPRVTTPDHAAASIEAWRSAPAVRREYWRGFKHGGIVCGALWFLGSLVLVLGFCALGVRP